MQRKSKNTLGVLATMRVSEKSNANMTSPSSFVMSVEGRVTGTGPVPATMAPMEVDLIFRAACFGKFKLPQVKTRSGGSEIKIYDQTIQVLDMAAFRGFVKSIINDDSLVLTLDNGQCSITAFGVTGRCTYRKDIGLKGMDGPATRIVDVKDGVATFIVTNPSAMEIDHGISMFDIQTLDGGTIAQLKGPLAITRGECEVSMALSRASTGPSPGSDVTMVGMGGENEAWTSETIKFFRTTLALAEKFFPSF